MNLIKEVLCCAVLFVVDSYYEVLLMGIPYVLVLANPLAFIKY
jgi:hypothetical protein